MKYNNWGLIFYMKKPLTRPEIYFKKRPLIGVKST
jgi:hypothetical protein